MEPVGTKRTVMDSPKVLARNLKFEGVLHELWDADRPAIRIYDEDAGELVGITEYPNRESAEIAWAKIDGWNVT